MAIAKFQPRLDPADLGNPVGHGRPTLLTALKINEVSSVDRGAGVGARVMLMKREAMAKQRAAIALAKDLAAQTFDDANGDASAQELTAAMMTAITTPLGWLQQSVASILADPNVDQKAMLTQTFTEFRAYVSSIVPAAMEKTFAAVKLLAAVRSAA